MRVIYRPRCPRWTRSALSFQDILMSESTPSRLATNHCGPGSLTVSSPKTTFELGDRLQRFPDRGCLHTCLWNPAS